MPSTYTLNNGIELIATGEQSGTWGDTTNTNLELLDAALDGQVTVTLPSAGTSGSPNTLAISDGAASDGRNRMVIFNDGGDLGATAYVQLTPNDAEKIIYVRNDLAGSRSIILFQGTYNASNDYEVPAGTTAVIYFDGGGSGAVAANVFNNAYFDSLRLGSVSVTEIIDDDTMATASATNIATSESIKAYVDTQVGANNELSEVLANGNTSGGTAIQMTTTDELQFRDTALKISSSADGQLDIDADTEIEIVAPTVDIDASTAMTIDTAALTVTGAVDLNTSLNVDGTVTADGLTVDGNIGLENADIITFKDTSNNNRGILTFDANNDIVIGPAGAGVQDIKFKNNGAKTRLNIDVGGDISFYEDTGTTAKFFWDASAERLGVGGTTTNATLHVHGNSVISNGNFFSIQSSSGLSPELDEASNGWAFTTDGSERMRIDSSGNVGIGTSSPTAPLSVVYGGGAVGAQITGNASYAQMQLSAAGANTNAYFTFGANGTGKGIIQRNAVDVITVDSSANVGILTSSPNTTLNVNGTSSFGTTSWPTTTVGKSAGRSLVGNEGLSIIWNEATAGAGNTGVLYIGAKSGAGASTMGYAALKGGTENATNLSSFFTVSTTNSTGTLSERMRIDSSGNVGIGTSSPEAKVEIQDGSDSKLRLQTTVGTDRKLNIGITSSTNAVINVESNHDLEFHTNNTERMRITSGGVVTIGDPNASSYGGGLTVATATGSYITVADTGSGEQLRLEGGSGLARIGTMSNHDLVIITNGTSNEVARFDTNGNFMVGDTNTNPIGNHVSQVIANGTNGLGVHRDGGVPFKAGTDADRNIIEVYRQGSLVGGIGVFSTNNLYVGSSTSGHSGLQFGSSQILPMQPAGTASDNVVDFGAPTERFQNLYLSGGVFLGGTGSSNNLADYEEGTWTPTLPNGGTFSFSATSPRYIKVGNKVTVSVYLAFINPTANTSQFAIGGLPFASKNTTNYYTGGSFGYAGQNNLSDVLVITGVGLSYVYFHENDGPGNSITNNTMRSKGLTGDAADAMIFTLTYFT